MEFRPVRKAARLASRGDLRRYPYGHFDIYHDPQVKADRVEFLTRVMSKALASFVRAADDFKEAA